MVPMISTIGVLLLPWVHFQLHTVWSLYDMFIKNCLLDWWTHRYLLVFLKTQNYWVIKEIEKK